MADNIQIPESAKFRLIHIDPDIQRKEFLKLLHDYSAGFERESIKTVIGSKFYNQLRKKLVTAEERLESSFTLVFLGEFKRGKSTLINALLGEHIVSTDVLPETVTINRLRYGSSTKLEAVLPGGKRVLLKLEDLQSEKLKKILKQLSEPPEYLEIQSPSELLKGIDIVDTPGIGDLFQRFDTMVQSYLPMADAIIFVISALSPLSDSERSFIEFSIRPYDFPKILFVVNGLDMLQTKDERESLLREIRERFSRLFPDAMVFGLSALDEICRLSNRTRPNPTSSDELQVAFQEFRECINTSILLNRDVLMLDRTVGLVTEMIECDRSELIRIGNALHLDKDRLQEAIRLCEDQNSTLHKKIDEQLQNIRNLILALSDEASEWMDEFLDNVEEKVIDQIDNFSYVDLQRHFPFFFADSIQDALYACVEAQQGVILDSIRNMSISLDNLGNLQAEQDELQKSVSAMVFDKGTWTMMDNLKLLIPFVGGGVLSIFAVGIVDRKIGANEKVENYKQHMKLYLSELKETTNKTLHSIYGHVAESIANYVGLAYQEQLETTLISLNRALELKAQGEREAKVAFMALSEGEGLVDHALQSLQNMQNKLKTDVEKILIE